MHRTVVFIKLGGAIITNKEMPMQLRPDVLNRLVREIAKARAEDPDRLIIVGHGQGSFGHVPAVKYKTMQGFIHDDSRFGMAIVQDSAAQLNRLVVHAFLEAGLPAVSLYPSNSLVTKDRVAESFCVDVFEEYIRQGLFPITTGDVIVDRARGCTIWSTEEVLSFFAQRFQEKGWNVQQIIHVTEVEGFYDHNGKVIRHLDDHVWPDLKSAVTATRGFDVTGGMLTKVQESLQLAEKGIDSAIISGLTKDNLYNLLTNKEWVGTRITKYNQGS
jgi:isopentenyl phosphate kinase